MPHGSIETVPPLHDMFNRPTINHWMHLPAQQSLPLPAKLLNQRRIGNGRRRSTRTRPRRFEPAALHPVVKTRPPPFMQGDNGDILLIDTCHMSAGGGTRRQAGPAARSTSRTPRISASAEPPVIHIPRCWRLRRHSTLIHHFQACRPAASSTCRSTSHFEPPAR